MSSRLSRYEIIPTERESVLTLTKVQLAIRAEEEGFVCPCGNHLSLWYSRRGQRAVRPHTEQGHIPCKAKVIRDGLTITAKDIYPMHKICNRILRNMDVPLAEVPEVLKGELAERRVKFYQPEQLMKVEKTYTRTEFFPPLAEVAIAA